MQCALTAAICCVAPALVEPNSVEVFARKATPFELPGVY
jgi:hypothetical protein